MDVGKNDRKEQVEESWIPKTPFKPILPKPPIMYTDEQGFRMNQEQVKRLRSSGAAFETWSACSNGNWEIALQTKKGTSEQVLNGKFTSLLALQDQASAVLNGDFQLQSNGLWSHNFSQNSQDGIGISHGPGPDLNLLPGETAESISQKTAIQMAPVTPGKSPGAETAFSEMQHLCTNDQELAKNSFGAVSEVITENGNDIGPCETPRQKPRRRKHRPKVITEGKPRIRKPATPKPSTPSPNPTGKRKYVRKKPLEQFQTTSTPLTQCKAATGEPKNAEASKPANYSCRRSLNFDTEGHVNSDGGSQLQPTDVNGWCKSKLTVNFGPGIEVMVEPACDLSHSIDQMRQKYDSLLQQRTPKQPPGAINSLPEKRAPSEPLAAAQKRKRNGECQNKHVVRGDQMNTHCAHQKTTEIILYTTTQLPPRRTNAYNWENRRTEWANYNYSNQEDNFSTNTAGIYYNAVYAFEALNRQNSTASSTSCVTSLTSSKDTAKQEIKGVRRSNIQSSSSISTQVERPTKKRSTTPTTLREVASIARRPPMSYNVHQAEILISSLTQKLQQLDINRETSATLVPYSYGTINEQQNALVLYGRDGTVVPFTGPFQPIKKRQPRPKVDLDEETGRVWRLLLENINSQGIDGTDEEKAKWWKEERDVFSGRANSFIARMHLVQGDRRFTPWKGSVVDSVVGVFLTQNVSDHLSSSAFMSLAANFPLKSTSKETTEEPIVCFPDLEYPISDMSNQSICDQSSVILHDSEPDEEKEADFSNRSITNDVISSQNSVVSSQNSADSPGDSENNAETEQMDGYNTFTELLMMAGRKELHKDLSTVEKVETQGENNNLSGKDRDIVESGSALNILEKELQKTSESDLALKKLAAKRKEKGRRVGGEIRDDIDWDALKKEAESNGRKRERTPNTMDSLDWEAVRCADVSKIADTIKERGMNNVLAGRIKDFLNRLVTEHGSIDLEWLRDVPPDKAKDYLLTIRGLGLKSVECVRLLTLHHLAFPVDVNVGRIAVRLGWVPLQPLPESLQLHLLELYPIQESIQKYLWPRLCKLDQKTLYELHYQLITFGKVFCTKSKPNCNACPMRGECRHFASAFASARLALPGPEEKSIVSAAKNRTNEPSPSVMVDQLRLPLPQPIEKPEDNRQLSVLSYEVKRCEPIVEEPASPEPECSQVTEIDIEDTFREDPDEIPTIKLDIEEFTHNLQSYMQNTMELQEGEMSKALVSLTEEAASIPMPKLKNVSRLRTEHHVYELPDSHPLLEGLERREADDPCSYLLAIWTPGETANSTEPPESTCNRQEHGKLCDEKTCFSCNSVREANSQIVRGTLLIPCRTAMRGSFPLNGTYFQVNEVFADHDSSLNPIDVPRSWLWNLPRRTVYFGTSIPTIFKGLTTEGIQHCFWRGYVCVRGFDQKTRAPRPLLARLHFPASKLNKAKG